MKQITPEQTQELFNLVERHAIKYYDVQIEIVDHYASTIEEIWGNEPDLSFLEAQKRVYREFWDFKSLEEEKKSVLEKGYVKQFLRELKSWLRLPKILLSMLIGFGLFELTKQFDSAIYYLMNFTFYTSLFSFFYLIFLRTSIESTLQNKFLQLDTAGGSFGLAATFGILSIQWADTAWTFNMGLGISIFVPIWLGAIIFGQLQIKETIKNIHLNFKPIQ